MVRTQHITAGSPGSIPGWGTNIPQVKRGSQFEKKKRGRDRVFLDSRNLRNTGKTF